MLDSLPYGALVFLAVVLGLAPFFPMPHLLEKLIMLKNGTLAKPIDIFDLLMHATPVILLIAKLVKDYVLTPAP
ncbi:MAG: hypothetical protein HQK86_06500 [Nitrospinae bacterium]|nr:hypothetical protein [Nitrospinota bacterium]